MPSLTPSTRLAAALRSRTDALAALFDNVAQTRMAGVPILNPALRIEALGFELCQGADAGADAGAVGVLITPWCMNLVWFPLERLKQLGAAGRSRSRRVGAECFDFISGYETTFGSYEACSLFSPMFDFADHAAARATADAVLEALRRPLVAPPSSASPGPVAPTTAPALAARRAFLFGRRSAPGAA